MIITKTYTSLSTETALGLTEEQIARLHSISVSGTFGSYTINGIGYASGSNTYLVEVGTYPSSSSSTLKTAKAQFTIIDNGFDLQMENVWKAGGTSPGSGSFKGTIKFCLI